MHTTTIHASWCNFIIRCTVELSSSSAFVCSSHHHHHHHSHHHSSITTTHTHSQFAISSCLCFFLLALPPSPCNQQQLFVSTLPHPHSIHDQQETHSSCKHTLWHDASASWSSLFYDYDDDDDLLLAMIIIIKIKCKGKKNNSKSILTLMWTSHALVRLQ